MIDEYFELIRAWVQRARDDETEEFGHHPCAPHEKHQNDKCPELCKCGHPCYDHVFLDGKNLYGPKPTKYICVGAPECPCRMFGDKEPG